MCRASLSHLRSLYAADKDRMIKEAPALSHKALYPSNLEQQNVQLVLKLFNEKTIVGLAHYGSKSNLDVSGTTKFLNIILRLWNILNVKSTDKGQRKRDSTMDPIRSVNDENVFFAVGACLAREVVVAAAEAATRSFIKRNIICIKTHSCDLRGTREILI